MPNIVTVLREEIVRLARKEVKKDLLQLRKQVTAQRKQVAALRKQIVEIEKRIKRVGRPSKPAATAASDSEAPGRFSVSGLKTLRARLGLSAADFGRLVGVSGQSIYNWESGKVRPQRAQLAALRDIRPLGKKEAAARLDALPG